MDSAFTPRHRGGAGTPMVCIHGFTDTWRTWELVLPHLEAHHDVLAPTLPGHAGGPPLPEPAGAGPSGRSAGRGDRGRDGWPLDAERIDCPLRIVWGTADKVPPWPGAAVHLRDRLLPHAE